MKTNQITSFQLIFVLSGAQIGVGFITLYRDIFEAGAGPDAWISVLIAGLIAQVAIFLIVHLASRFPDETIATYSKKLLGPIGWLLSFGIFIYFLIVSAMVCRHYAAIIKVWELPKTPLFILILMMLAPASYVLFYEIRIIARFSLVIYFSTWWLIATIFFPLAKGDILNILPIGQSGLFGIASGALGAIFAVAGIELLLLLYPFVDKKKDVLMATAIGNTLTLSFYFLMVFASAFFFSPADVTNQMWPSLQLLKLVEFSFIQRFDTFALSFWMLQIILTATINLWAASFTIYKLFNINDFKTSSVIVVILAFIFAVLPRDQIQVDMTIKLLGKVCLILGYFIPITLLAIYYVQKWRKKLL